MTTTFTTHFALPIPDFLSEPWHETLQDTIRAIDIACFEAFVKGGAAFWVNSKAYTPGVIVIDPNLGSLWQCVIAHTSAASPTTFANDRIAHPTFWNPMAPFAISPVANKFVDSIDPTGAPHLSQPSFLGLTDIETGVAPGTYGGNITQGITFDQYGRITGVTPAATLLSGDPTQPEMSIVTTSAPATPNQASWQKVRVKLITGTTLWVRNDGSNSNDGSANDAAHAFLTMQEAINRVAGKDLNGQTVTLRYGGTFPQVFTGTITLANVVGTGTVTILGDSATPSNVTIDSGTTCISAAGVRQAWTINGLKLKATTAGHNGISMSANSVVSFLNLDFNDCNNVHINTTTGAYTIISGPYTISGNAGVHWNVTSQGILQCAGQTITFSGTRAFTTFLQVLQAAIAITNSNTYAGTATSATGIRHAISGNGVVETITAFNQGLATFTVTSANPGVVTHTNHGLGANQRFTPYTTGALPTNLVAGTVYFVKTVLDANTFTLSATPGGAAIDTTAGTQSGTHRAIEFNFPGQTGLDPSSGGQLI